MKLVLAFIQPFMADQVAGALHEIAGVTGATFTDVRGFGRGRARNSAWPENVFGTVAKTRIDVIVADDLADRVVLAIQTAAHTGNRGDGKVFVMPVTRGVRVATGEGDDGTV